jgi:hypothetical protein
VNHTCLDNRRRPDRVDRVRKAGQAVAYQHQHIADRAVLDLGEDRSQYLVPSPPSPTHRPRMSKCPSAITASAIWTGRLAT